MNKSTFLLKSTKNKSFGTAFCIDHDSNGVFLLTCEHVIDACGKDDLEINGQKAELQVTSSTNDLIDLAVVYVKDLQAKPLKLSLATLEEGSEFIIDGFKPHKSGEYKQEALKGRIKKISQIHANSQSIDSYELYIGEDDSIEKGYSGSAVVSKNSGQVVAVATDRTSTGKQAYAIPLKYLKEVWTELNPKLFDSITPFVGLSAFGREDSSYFFGRDKEIGEILTQIKNNSILAVIGDSGSGKSSLIKAGVIPKLLFSHEVIETRPARNPFLELARCVTKICENKKYSESDIGYFAKEIESQIPQDIHRVLERLFKEEEKELLLYVDQFEELFTLCDKALQTSFVDTLLYLLSQQSSHLKINIIFTMRRDYFNLLSKHEAFKENIETSTFLVRRMNDENLKEVIEKPLELLSVNKEEIEQLSSIILWDMGDEAKEITLLQIALTETWRERANYEHNILSSYVGIGRVTGALSHLATNAMESLDAKEKELFKYIFIRIVKFNDMGGMTRRLADRDEFSDEAWKLVQKLASVYSLEHNHYNNLGRLLKLSTSDDKSEDEEVIELIHEALTTQWDTYVDWIQTVNKENRKRIHNMLMEQSKNYKKETDKKLKKKFLLSGYALEESTKLLDDEYRSYLSEFEMKFLEASQKSADSVVFWKRFGVGTLVVLLGLSGYFWFEAEKARKNNVKITQNLINVIDEIFHKKITKTEKYTLIINTLKNSNENKILFYVARAYYKNKNYLKAIEIYEKIEKEHISDYWFYMELGQAYGAKRNFKSAILVYSKAIEINRKKHEAYVNLAYSYRRLGLLSDSISQYQEAILVNIQEYKNSKNIKYKFRLESRRYRAYTQLSLAYQKNKNFIKGINELKKAIELRPKKYNAYIFLFQMYLERNEKLPLDFEEKFLEIFQKNKKRMIDYEIIKTLYKVLNKKEVSLSFFKEKYVGVRLRHKTLHKSWINRVLNQEVQEKCDEVYKAFNAN